MTPLSLVDPEKLVILFSGFTVSSNSVSDLRAKAPYHGNISNGDLLDHS